MNTGYDFFEHTADVGIRARASTLRELFIHMARGLVELIAEDSRLEPRQTREIALAAENTEALLVSWLSELLFWFSTERFLPVRYVLDDVTPRSLRGRIEGDHFDPSRHVQGREVKAITHHLLSVQQRNSVWEGQVLVDI